MRLLFIVQRFHQGWGGAPESVRLTATRLTAHGIVSDVTDRGLLHRDVGALSFLPVDGAPASTFDTDAMGRYDAFLIAGPWQHYRATRRIVDHIPNGRPLFYLPRGGLADIEFRRGKRLKKIVYLRLLERHFLECAKYIVHSSALELRASTRIANLADKALVIPDHFTAPVPVNAPMELSRPAPFTIGFMAEIGVRKGLVPFLRGLLAWFSQRPATARTVNVIIAGAPRPDAKAYLEEAQAIAHLAPAGMIIRFIGAIPHEQRSSFYTSCDLFAVPSLFESFCLTALEALSAGCRLLVAPTLGVLEQLPHDPAITIFRSWEVEDISAALTVAAGAADRDRTRDLAQATIRSLNDRSDRLWLERLTRT